MEIGKLFSNSGAEISKKAITALVVPVVFLYNHI